MSENDIHMPMGVQTPSTESQDSQRASTTTLMGEESSAAPRFSSVRDDPEIEFRESSRPQPVVRPKELPRPQGSDIPGGGAACGASRAPKGQRERAEDGPASQSSGDGYGGYPLSMYPPHLRRDVGAMAAPRYERRNGDGYMRQSQPREPPPYMRPEERVRHEPMEFDNDGDEQSGQPLLMYPPVNHGRLPVRLTGMPVQFRPETYDGTGDWPEYLVYFEQLGQVYNWDMTTMATVLGLSLKGSARSVLASLQPSERMDYLALKHALTQNFCPLQQIHVYQAELKTRSRKPKESLADLGRDVARMTRLAYPTADQATRETIGINAFLDAIPGPAVEIRLSVVRGHPTTILEAVALAMEVEAILEAGNTGKDSPRRGFVHQVDDGETSTKPADMKRLIKTIEKLESEIKEMKADKAKPARERNPRPISSRKSGTDNCERECFRCGKKGHWIKDCRQPVNQGNEGGRPRSQ